MSAYTAGILPACFSQDFEMRFDEFVSCNETGPMLVFAGRSCDNDAAMLWLLETLSPYRFDPGADLHRLGSIWSPYHGQVLSKSDWRTLAQTANVAWDGTRISITAATLTEKGAITLTPVPDRIRWELWRRSGWSGTAAKVVELMLSLPPERCLAAYLRTVRTSILPASAFTDDFAASLHNEQFATNDLPNLDDGALELFATLAFEGWTGTVEELYAAATSL